MDTFKINYNVKFKGHWDLILKLIQHRENSQTNENTLAEDERRGKKHYGHIEY